MTRAEFAVVLRRCLTYTSEHDMTVERVQSLSARQKLALPSLSAETASFLAWYQMLVMVKWEWYTSGLVDDAS